MTNPYRGEITVDIGSRTCTLRLTFQAMVAIETALDESLISIAQRFAKGNARLSDIHAILHAALTACGQPDDDLQEAVLHDGLAHHLETCSLLLCQAIQGSARTTGEGEGASPAVGKP